MHKFSINLIQFFILIFPFIGFAQELPVSQERAPDQNWEEALNNEFAKWETLGFKPGVSMLQEVTLNTSESIPEWTHGLPALNTLNSLTYTNRMYTNPNPGNYKRRAPWLFPADGCYAKAAHVSAVAKAQGFGSPGKVYAFGHLSMATRFAKEKRVWWSYHMASAYQIGGVIYVLDPMMNSSSAVTLDQWVSRMSSDPKNVQVKLCDGNSYSPYSKCVGGNGNGAYLGHIPEVLKLEYQNLQNIGMPPQPVLAP